MGVDAGLYMCDVVKKFTFAISSPDEFLLLTYSLASEGVCLISHCCPAAALLYRQQPVVVLCSAAGLI